MKRIVIVALIVTAAPLAAQQRRGRCTGDPADSVLLAAGPVYRDCEVDRVAELNGPLPRLDMSAMSMPPRTGCFSAEFEFVVGADGTPEVPTIKPKGGNDRSFQEIVGQSIGVMRYTPAVRDSQAVRQLVRLKRAASSVIVVERVTAGSSGPPMRPTSRSPSC